MDWLNVVWSLFVVFSGSILLLKNKRKEVSFWIPARELSITWVDDPQYWEWTHLDSCSSDVAELVDVCWMDIAGRIKTRRLPEKTSFAAYLVFKLTDKSRNLEKATASVRFTEEICQGSGSEGYAVRIDTKNLDPAEKGRLPRQRSDGWMEIKLGDFYNDLGDDGEVEMRLIETDNNKWKSGLLVRGIDVRSY